MTRIVRVERRRRGVLGWLIKLAFILFNLVMVLLIVYAWVVADRVTKPDEHVGAILGASTLTLFFAVIWAIGDVILGTLAYLSRGKTIVVEEAL